MRGGLTHLPWALVLLSTGTGCELRGVGIGGSPPVARAQAVTSPSVRSEVHALARLEPQGGLIAVGARPGARIERVLVRDGDEVKKGQTLGILEGNDAAQIQVEQAETKKREGEAERSRRRSRLALARKREDRMQKVRIEKLEDIYDTLKTRSEKLAKTADEVAKLPPATLSTKDRYDLEIGRDRLKIEGDRAYLELEQARADKEALGPLRSVEDEELEDGGAAEATLLSKQLDLARANVEQTTIKAPVAGRVLEVVAHAGEISSGPLLLMGDLSTMVATAEVDQAELPAIEVGDSAVVTVGDSKVNGKVTQVARTVGKNRLVNVDPRLPQDLRVVKVTIQLEQAEPAAHFVNMQVDAAIQTKAADAK